MLLIQSMYKVLYMLEDYKQNKNIFNYFVKKPLMVFLFTGCPSFSFKNISFENNETTGWKP